MQMLNNIYLEMMKNKYCCQKTAQTDIPTIFCQMYSFRDMLYQIDFASIENDSRKLVSAFIYTYSNPTGISSHRHHIAVIILVNLNKYDWNVKDKIQ